MRPQNAALGGAPPHASEDLDAASVGHHISYEDPAYFSRDYKKLFGAPPQRDIARLRGSLEPGGATARV